MFQHIMRLFDSYIYFGGSIIHCDEKNVCAVYHTEDSQTVDTQAVDAHAVHDVSSK